ncbi:DUF2255 family protein [Mangrovimonas sp. AS39]|uniref:DUF2255 family protein n=1 Tax=Mangrovimonas futianensis TaxID=2895523 RepID=UPI001E3B3690|nr:DUF2255 family protein [Mangrovimonas futianensis]MCF1192234.1 DUF2255 family protein [Mangrovimonas futianensis]MCF1196017.1 DUF2255 family protein [Mangrovimonas futianensis]
MSKELNHLTQDDITTIAERNDFHIAPFREDGETYGTLTWIWVVEVQGELYVRAYNGTRSRWYEAAIQQKAGKIKAAGLERAVKFEPVSGAVNDQIDEAYKLKYSGSPYLGSMISERAKAATVKVF